MSKKLFMYLKRIFGSRTVWVITLIFVIHLDFMLTVFALEGGMKDGETWKETNPTMVRAITTGDRWLIVKLALGMSVGIGVLYSLWDFNPVFKPLFWLLLICRLLLFINPYLA